MKKILMISYYYPPLKDVGGLRALGFSKYISQFGWKPYVLTVANPDKSFCSVGNTLPSNGVEVFRSHSILNLYWIMGKFNGLVARIFRVFRKELKTNLFINILCIPDIFIGWIPLTFIRGLKIIRMHDIDVIYVSCKPFSSSLIALLLKWVTKRPVVLDLRDPNIFSLSDTKPFSIRLNHLACGFIEKRVFQAIDKLILVTDMTRSNFLSFYPFLNSKSYRIYNGFLEYDVSICTRPYHQFTIAYVGDYYADYEDSELIFSTLQRIRSSTTLSPCIRFVYCGGDTKWICQMRDKYDLQDIIQTRGPVSRDQAVEILFRSSVIYLRIVKDMISTKLFEGLMTGRPFLVATSNIEVISLIARYAPRSEVVAPHDVTGMTNSMLRLHERWLKGELPSCPSSEYLEKFNKTTLTQDFVKVLGELV